MEKQPIDDFPIRAPMQDDQLLALEEALDKLAEKDPIKAKLVQMRYYAGMKLNEIAALLGISATTAHRYWAYARAWLHQEITRQDEGH